MAAEIPEVIQRYQDAHDRHDVEGALAAFSAEATVHDEGRQWRGISPQELRQFKVPAVPDVVKCICVTISHDA